MILSASDQKKYPKFARYVRKQIPKLARDPRVVDSMHDLVAISKSKVRAALAWGKGPTILVVPSLMCRPHSKAVGCYRPANVDQIEIDAQAVQQFEKKPKGKRSTGTRIVPFAGVVLMHELVHWADYKVDGERTRVSSMYHDVASKWEWLVFSEFSEDMRGD